MAARRKRRETSGPPQLAAFASWDEYHAAVHDYGMTHDLDYALDALMLLPGESVEEMREKRAQQAQRIAAQKAGNPLGVPNP